uniref:Uncharacterized protein n=1 Tax=Alexandrium monilatum TaxID=311494 RepID=A0A7S4VD02_9DINO
MFRLDWCTAPCAPKVGVGPLLLLASESPPPGASSADGMPVYKLRGSTATEVVITGTDEGDTNRRLRLKVHQLEQELAHLVGTREDYYSKKVAQSEERAALLEREKDAANKAWREKHECAMRESRAGVTIMCSLLRSKRRRLEATIEAERKSYEKQISAAQERMAQREAEHASTTQALQKKLENIVSDCEARLSRQQADADEKISNLESQLSTARDETQRLEDVVAKGRSEIQDLQTQLRQRLADIENLEALVLAPSTKIKETQHKAKMQKETLEKEIADYVRYIVATHRAASREAAALPSGLVPARGITAVRPSTPTTPPKAHLPMQLPASARSMAPSVLPPLGEEVRAGGPGARSISHYRRESARH